MNNWSPISHPQDWILLHKVRSPGVATVGGAKLKWRLEVRRMRGMSNGFIVVTGKDLCPFTVMIDLYDAKDWDGWNKFLPILLAKPMVTAAAAPGVVITDALDIQHPILEMAKIHSGVVQEVTMPEERDERGIWRAKIDFLEFAGAPKQQIAKTEGSKATPEQDPYDQQIRDLTSERNIKAMAKG